MPSSTDEAHTLDPATDAFFQARGSAGYGACSSVADDRLGRSLNPWRSEASPSFSLLSPISLSLFMLAEPVEHKEGRRAERKALVIRCWLGESVSFFSSVRRALEALPCLGWSPKERLPAASRLGLAIATVACESLRSRSSTPLAQTHSAA